MATITNATNKTLHLALAKEVEIKGVKTVTLELFGCESVTVPNGVLEEKTVKAKIYNGILKTNKKAPPKPPQNMVSGGSFKDDSKSGGDKGKQKADGGSDKK